MELAELEPSWELKPTALEVWRRHAERIKSEGRWDAIDRDALTTYAATLATYRELQDAVDAAGVLVSGRNGELVKNPVLSPLTATRDSLLRLSRAVPLVDSAAALESARFDRWADSL
jgi:P27 family predicted phage terminase small subunit